MILQNMTLDNSTRRELVNYATELLYDQLYENIMANISLIEDNERYRHWYHGYTKIKLGKYSAQDYAFIYDIETYATSGSIFTRYFDHKFDPEKVEKYLRSKVKIKTHDSVGFNPNLTLHLEIEKIMMIDLSDNGRDDFVLAQPPQGNFVTDESLVLKNYTPPDNGFGEPFITFTRGVTHEEIKKQTLEKMPGFRLTWNFSGMQVVAHGFYSNEHATRAFVRYHIDFLTL